MKRNKILTINLIVVLAIVLVFVFGYMRYLQTAISF